MEHLIKRIVALTDEKRLLLNNPRTYADKRTAVREIDARIAALFAQKRELSKARYTKDDY